MTSHVYSTETVAKRKAIEKTLEKAEVSMLRCIGEISLRAKRRNIDIPKFMGGENITEKCRKQELGWK